MKYRNRTNHASVAKMSAIIAAAQEKKELPATLPAIKRLVKSQMAGLAYNDNALHIVLEQFGIEVKTTLGKAKGLNQKPKYARELAVVMRQVISNLEAELGIEEGELRGNGVHQALVNIIGGRSADLVEESVETKARVLSPVDAARRSRLDEQVRNGNA